MIKKILHKYWPILLGTTVSLIIMGIMGYSIKNVIIACILSLTFIIGIYN